MTEVVLNDMGFNYPIVVSFIPSPLRQSVMSESPHVISPRCIAVLGVQSVYCVPWVFV